MVKRSRLLWVLIPVCAALFLADLLYPRHAYFRFAGWPGFYAGYGFLCCMVLVLVARWMRKLIRRDEDYYD